MSRGHPTRDSTPSLGLHVRLMTYRHKKPSILNMLSRMIRDSSVGIMLEYRRIVFRFLAREIYFSLLQTFHIGSGADLTFCSIPTEHSLAGNKATVA